MGALIISGVTAMPVETELGWLLQTLPQGNSLYSWLLKVYQAIVITNTTYPFVAYGFDWLAFAHIVIALAFIGILRNPVRNIWIIEWAMLCCIAIIPFAFTVAPFRHIPIGWTIIDCLFGVVGIMPLYYCRILIKKLEKLEEEDSKNIIF
jgi:hypothetical protein